MKFVDVNTTDGIATTVLSRDKVNALNGPLVHELRRRLEELEADPEVKAVILTGKGKFFSFGFDIPEFLSYTKEAFSEYLTDFTDLYTYLFLYPKPLVAALNGHTIAGGCMLALACDARVMVSGRARISLNEIGFGSSVFAGSTEMLRFWVGSANATDVLYSGAMYSAEEAMGLGLVQAVASPEDLLEQVVRIARDLSSKSLSAFASIKSHLRKTVADEMRVREPASIREFVDIWYSNATRAKLYDIKIY